MDLLGHFLRATPGFRGKGRLVNRWVRHPGPPWNRERILPGGAIIHCDLLIPYEAMVWIEAEEETDLQTLRLLLKENQHFVDCGANIGLWTLVAATGVGSGGKVTALEPNPKTYDKLVHNVMANGFRLVQPLRAAAGETSGVLPFRCEREHNISRIAENEDAGTIMTPMVSLDQVVGTDRVDGLKIDVEGFELSVLKGADRLLDRWQPWVCVEFNSLLAQVRRISDWPVHKYLMARGYTARVFSDALRGFDQDQLPQDWECAAYANLFYQSLRSLG